MTSISWMLDNLNVSLLFLLLLFSFLFPCLFILSYGRFPQLYLSNEVYTLTFLFLKALPCFLDVPLYSILFSFCGCIKNIEWLFWNNLTVAVSLSHSFLCIQYLAPCLNKCQLNNWIAYIKMSWKNAEIKSRLGLEAQAELFPSCHDLKEVIFSSESQFLYQWNGNTALCPGSHPGLL